MSPSREDQFVTPKYNPIWFRWGAGFFLIMFGLLAALYAFAFTRTAQQGQAGIHKPLDYDIVLYAPLISFCLIAVGCLYFLFKPNDAKRMFMIRRCVDYLLLAVACTTAGVALISPILLSSDPIKGLIWFCTLSAVFGLYFWLGLTVMFLLLRPELDGANLTLKSSPRVIAAFVSAILIMALIVSSIITLDDIAARERVFQSLIGPMIFGSGLMIFTIRSFNTISGSLRKWQDSGQKQLPTLP